MNKYLEILNRLHQKQPPKIDDHILIIDSLNMFIRNFGMVKTINPSGNHVGGLVGFLRSLAYMVRLLDPTQVICVFDGKGASMNRKNINPNYKANREHIRIVNWGLFESKKEENESMHDQITRLFDYLECLPVQVVIEEKVEADDIISFIAQKKSQEGSRVTIVSTDKDFFQIISENIRVYSPVKKKMYGSKEFFEEHGVPPENYLLIKALIGDPSDNLRGVNRAGVKTVLKLFPKLKTHPNQGLDYIYEHSENNLDKPAKLYANIINDWDLVEKNHLMMDIRNPRLTDEEKEAISETISNFRPYLHTGSFSRYLDQDRIEGITNDTDKWLQTFNTLTIYSKST